MLVYDGAIAPRQIVHRLVPGRALEGPVWERTYLRIDETVGGFDCFRQVDGFQAEITEARRMLRVEFNLADRILLDADVQAAADAAVGARFFPALNPRG